MARFPKGSDVALSNHKKSMSSFQRQVRPCEQPGDQQDQHPAHPKEAHKHICLVIAEQHLHLLNISLIKFSKLLTLQEDPPQVFDIINIIMAPSQYKSNLVPNILYQVEIRASCWLALYYLQEVRKLPLRFKLALGSEGDVLWQNVNEKILLHVAINKDP
ncbi:hypothetical protein G6F37_011665 [Rhizopus arrhizus]|nr:hypothetical protein G6F38_008730 [Rhizopus arrhizus]KAG1148105.1 hypothetical protein G6F37_011665 [Rhizopus arrhizus]